MSKQDDIKTKLLLDRATEDMLLDLIEQYPSPEQLKGKVEFSNEHNRKMDEIIRKVSTRKRSKSLVGRLSLIGRNVAAVFGLLFIVSFLIAFTVPTVRIAIKNFLLTSHDDYTQVDFVTDEKHVDERYNYPVHVPDGFKVVDINETSRLMMVLYINEENEFIRIERFAGQTSLTLDTQDAVLEEIDILHGTGQLKTKNGMWTLVFSGGDFVYKITTDFDKQTIIDMANSIIIK